MHASLTGLIARREAGLRGPNWSDSGPGSGASGGPSAAAAAAGAGDGVSLGSGAGVGGDVALWRRAGVVASLTGHEGCVNHCEYNPQGTLLATGSDDTTIRIWQAHGAEPRRTPVGTFETGHADNIFCCRWLDPAGERLIASCSGDGTVRLTDAARGVTRTIYTHEERAKKLAVEPGNPHLLLSCSEDGTICHIDVRERSRSARVMAAPRAGMHSLEVNSISLPWYKPWLLVAGCADEFCRVYDRRMPPARGQAAASAAAGAAARRPQCVATLTPGGKAWPGFRADTTGVTGVDFADEGDEVLATYSGDYVYSFRLSDAERRAQWAARDLEERRRVARAEFAPPGRVRSSGSGGGGAAARSGGSGAAAGGEGGSSGGGNGGRVAPLQQLALAKVRSMVAEGEAAMAAYWARHGQEMAAEQRAQLAAEAQRQMAQQARRQGGEGSGGEEEQQQEGQEEEEEEGEGVDPGGDPRLALPGGWGLAQMTRAVLLVSWMDQREDDRARLRSRQMMRLWRRQDRAAAAALGLVFGDARARAGGRGPEASGSETGEEDASENNSSSSGSGSSESGSESESRTSSGSGSGSGSGSSSDSGSSEGPPGGVSDSDEGVSLSEYAAAAAQIDSTPSNSNTSSTPNSSSSISLGSSSTISSSSSTSSSSGGGESDGTMDFNDEDSLSDGDQEDWDWGPGVLGERSDGQRAAMDAAVRAAEAAARVPAPQRPAPGNQMDWLRAKSLEDLGWMLAQGLSAPNGTADGAAAAVRLSSRSTRATRGRRQADGSARGGNGGRGSGVWVGGGVASDESGDEEEEEGKEGGDGGGARPALRAPQRKRLRAAAVGAAAGDQQWPHAWAVCFRGACNQETVKDVAFLGPLGRQQLVAAGSDGGLLFLWERATGKLVAALRGDRRVVNVIARHPTLPATFASCGIDSTVKVWGPCASKPARPLRSASTLVALAENELKRAGPVASRRATELGLGPRGWVPGGGILARRYLLQGWGGDSM